ncbi:MAG: leucine-rich repeat protein [Ruminococcus sp.]|nr:leucine-rich repeat protein [Ruminococcus sp.]
MKLKKILSCVLATAVAISSVAISAFTTTVAATETASWTSGDTTVTLYDDGSLVVSGTGDMATYSTSASTRAPWLADSTYYNAITSITISEGVTSVGAYAFYSSTTYRTYNVTSVSLPSTLTTIGKYAFSYSGVTSLTIPDSVTTMDTYAFSHCESLASISIGSGLTTLSDYVFQYCYALESITIPTTITSFGAGALRYTGLTSVVINDNITSLSNYLFQGCDSLTSVTIPDSVTTIGNYVFAACTALESITLPSSITTIGNYLFYNSTALKSITIPEGVTTIGTNFARGCTALESVTLPSSLTSLGTYAFYGDTALTYVNIPSGVTALSNYTFYNCTNKNLIIDLEMTTAPTLGTYLFTNVVGTIYVYSQETYDAVSANSTVTGATVVYIATTADVSAVIEAIKTASSTDTSSCTSGTASALTSAVEAAKTVLSIASSTQDDVDAAAAAITAAIAALVDGSALTSALATAEALDTTYCTSDSASALATAIDNANAALESSTATQDDVDAATAAINTALAGLSGVIYVDSEELRDTVAAVATDATVVYVASFGSASGVDTSSLTTSGSNTNQLAIINNWSGSGTAISELADATEFSITFTVTGLAVTNETAYIAFYDPTTGLSSWAPSDTTPAVAIPEEGTYTVTYSGSALSGNFNFLGIDLKNYDGSTYSTGNGVTSLSLVSITKTVAADVDTTEIKSAIVEADGYDTTNYTATSAAALTDALDAAIAVVGNSESTQTEVDAAVAAITAAINGLVDISDLAGTIETAEEVDTSLYTPSSVAEFTDALDAAKTVLANADATQDEVDAAVDALTAAIDALVELADTSDLVGTIETAEEIDTSLYTDSSVAALEAALIDANAVLENADATQDEVNEATDALIRAIENLAPKYSITGTVYVSDSDTETAMLIVVTDENDEVVTSIDTESMCEYEIEGLEAGTYTIIISGGKYAPRSYEIEVAGNLTQDVYLNPYGDINGDGEVTTADVGLANCHAKGVTLLEDYEFDCADVNLDGSVTTADVGKINSHAKGVVALW